MEFICYNKKENWEPGDKANIILCSYFQGCNICVAQFPGQIKALNYKSARDEHFLSKPRNSVSVLFGWPYTHRPQRESEQRDKERGVLSQPEIQWISIPPSPAQYMHTTLTYIAYINGVQNCL